MFFFYWNRCIYIFMQQSNPCATLNAPRLRCRAGREPSSVFRRGSLPDSNGPVEFCCGLRRFQTLRLLSEEAALFAVVFWSWLLRRALPGLASWVAGWGMGRQPGPFSLFHAIFERNTAVCCSKAADCYQSGVRADS